MGLPEAGEPEGQRCEHDGERHVRGVYGEPEPRGQGDEDSGRESPRKADAGPDGHVPEELLLILPDVLLDRDVELVVDQPGPPKPASMRCRAGRSRPRRR